jgi:hypothetical protein
MRRLLIAAAFLIGGLATTRAADPCGPAYVGFVERLSERANTLSAPRLATLHRQAVRIFHACDTGHMTDAEARLRELEAR